MTIDELTQKVDDLETEICGLLDDFEKETNIMVESVNISRIPMMEIENDRRTSILNNVKIPLQL